MMLFLQKKINFTLQCLWNPQIQFKKVNKNLPIENWFVDFTVTGITEKKFNIFLMGGRRVSFTRKKINTPSTTYVIHAQLESEEKLLSNFFLLVTRQFFLSFHTYVINRAWL